jgi:hypothetical protein
VHALVIVAATGPAALSIAGEKDRRTLDFLLATRLGNAEIVLGKLAACLVTLFVTMAAGLPIMLLFNLLGGIDPWLILLAWSGISSTAFFVTTLSIWFSTKARDGRRALNLSVLCVVAWVTVPVVVAVILPRFPLLRPPWWIATPNGWVLASSPIGVLMKLAGGLRPGIALAEAVAWMCGLQLLGGTVLVIGSIARLRSAYRVNMGGDGRGLAGRLKRPVWRFRPRPAVGDDPILWREMHTMQAGGVAKAIARVRRTLAPRVQIGHHHGRASRVQPVDQGFLARWWAQRRAGPRAY